MLRLLPISLAFGVWVYREIVGEFIEKPQQRSTSKTHRGRDSFRERSRTLLRAWEKSTNCLGNLSNCPMQIRELALTKVWYFSGTGFCWVNEKAILTADSIEAQRGSLDNEHESAGYLPSPFGYHFRSSEVPLLRQTIKVQT